jgi:hypothetical protein
VVKLRDFAHRETVDHAMLQALSRCAS